jgi:hypothetical protein
MTEPYFAPDTPRILDPEDVSAALKEQTETATSATQNARGEWVPAIPLPYFFQVIVPYCECHCHARFFGRHGGRALRRYEEHYALHHILKPAAS